MKKMILASTSTIHGEEFLEYLFIEIKNLFIGCKNILFIPFARPSGLSHLAYTKKVQDQFKKVNLSVIDYSKDNDFLQKLEKSDGIFIGEKIREKILSGTPYLGTSAGTNICGISIGTTNDMPIVEIKNRLCLQILPFNINPHFYEKNNDSKHMGESRETRIQEFLIYNKQPVVGLKEGSFLKINQENITLQGKENAIIFERSQKPYTINSGFNLKKLN
jgi:dipeptidase E